VVGDRAGERSLVLIGDDQARIVETVPSADLATLQAALEIVMDGGTEAYARLLAHLVPRVGAERALIIERLPEARVRVLAAHGERGFAVSRTIVERAFAATHPIVVDDAVADVAFSKAKSVFELGVRAVVAAPIRVRGHVVGALVVDAKQRAAFGSAAVAEVAAAALVVGALLGRTPAPAADAPAWIGDAMVLATADRAAASASRVLITGESGTGKELVARRIHAQSPRAAGPWVALNCAALAEGVLESELFGHEQGAFTGAVKRTRGCFEQADGGTLFLDEVGELKPATQAKLLRALQEGRFTRVGGEQPIDVDVRVVAATNRDLRALVQAGTFREDLFYRLAVIPIALPPLRARGEDLTTLTEHFFAQLGRELGRAVPRLAASAWARWKAYAWPGNVRELRNVVERLVVVTDGEEIEADQLPPELLTGAERPAGSLASAIASLESDMIRAALAQHSGNKSATARALGISRPTLDKKLRDYGLADG
jgi:DNA-binding NtrC family response regulator